MRGRDELCEDIKNLRELISTYKVLKLEQIIKTIGKKEAKAQKTILTLMKNNDNLFIHDDICSVSDNWVKDLDKAMIKAFWILLDFWDDVLFNTSAAYPAKIEFITEDDSFDIIVAEKGHEKMLNVFFSKVRDPQVKHLVAVDDEEQMTKLTFDGISAFCIVNTDGEVSYYRNEG